MWKLHKIFAENNSHLRMLPGNWSILTEFRLITWKTTRYPLVIINAVFPSLIFKNERKWATKWCSLCYRNIRPLIPNFFECFSCWIKDFCHYLLMREILQGLRAPWACCGHEATQCGLVCYTHPLWELPIMLWCLVQLAVSFERYCLGRFSLTQCHSEEALFFLFYRKSRAE